MNDLISRREAIDALNIPDYENGEAYLQYESDVNAIRSLPAQPERKKGKWILDDNPHDGDCRCSVCLMAIDQMHERNHGLLNALTGGKWWTFYNFCPHCGSKMRCQ